jgi:hypothetical protein
MFKAPATPRPRAHYCCILTLEAHYCCILTLEAHYCCILTLEAHYCCILTLEAQDWGISIFSLPARVRAHAQLHSSMLAPHVVLLQSARWDLHAWFVSKGMRPMSAWVGHPFVTEHMLREYEIDARAALFELVHAFPSTRLWGLVVAPTGVLSKAKSDAPFLQATLNGDAQAAVKAVLKAVAVEFGFVIVDWEGMIEGAQQTESCEPRMRLCYMVYCATVRMWAFYPHLAKVFRSRLIFFSAQVRLTGRT